MHLLEFTCLTDFYRLSSNQYIELGFIVTMI